MGRERGAGWMRGRRRSSEEPWCCEQRVCCEQHADRYKSYCSSEKPTVPVLCVGCCHSDAPCVGRAADVLGTLPGDPGVVPDIFKVVSTPHISLHVRLPSLPFLHTFCTLSARAAQRSFSGEYAWSDLLSDLSMVVA